MIGITVGLCIVAAGAIVLLVIEYLIAAVEAVLQ